MAKLYFRYGAMGSSKTANALMVRYNYLEKGQHPVLLKPAVDTRDGEKLIQSRLGISAECIFVEDYLEMVKKEWIGKEHSCDCNFKKPDCIIIDEAQFLTTAQVDLLAKIVDDFDVPVICYGLRTDFTSHLFEGSARLMEISDKIEEVPTVCWCGRRAHFTARIHDGAIVRSGERIMMGGNESYTSLCRRHYNAGIISDPSKMD